MTFAEAMLVGVDDMLPPGDAGSCSQHWVPFLICCMVMMEIGPYLAGGFYLPLFWIGVTLACFQYSIIVLHYNFISYYQQLSYCCC